MRKLDKKIRLWHITNKKNAEKIKKLGLKGGHNIHGIGRGSKATLWLSDTIRADAERYGNYFLKFEISESELEKLHPHKTQFSDETVYYIEKEGVIIPPEQILDPYEEYKNGTCDPSDWCEACCFESEDCPLLKLVRTNKYIGDKKNGHE